MLAAPKTATILDALNKLNVNETDVWIGLDDRWKMRTVLKCIVLFSSKLNLYISYCFCFQRFWGDVHLLGWNNLCPNRGHPRNRHGLYHQSTKLNRYLGQYLEQQTDIWKSIWNNKLIFGSGDVTWSAAFTAWKVQHFLLEAVIWNKPENVRIVHTWATPKCKLPIETETFVNWFQPI